MSYDALTPSFDKIPSVKVLINIGALLDIPTGTYIKGKHGESILNGGLAPLTGIVGIGNSFKSTLMHYMFLSAMSRIEHSTGSTYDTEVNIHEWHLTEMMKNCEEFKGENVIETQRWIITDKTLYSGNEWYAKQKEFLDNKKKNASKITVETPFLERDGKTLMKMLIPTFTEIDSFSEFETDDVLEMQEKNELGDSGANTMHMRQGLAKSRFLIEAPRVNCGSNNFLLMTAHIGKETTMQNAGPGGNVPITKLKHLKHGDKIKFVTDKFTFTTHNCWHCYNTNPLINQGTKGSEYPKDSNDNTNLDTDLNTVHIRNLRSKSGVSGMTQMLVVSQSEGVLPSLSEFHYIKEMDRYGIEGSNVSYSLCLYPDVKLSRTTVRNKIDNDPLLRRALNITAEMCQMNELWNTLPTGLLITPKELYERLKIKGFDWNNVLLCSRGWWTINNDKHSIPFLSTMDLLKMALPDDHPDNYFPYWMNKDTKKLK